jgi:uncharacterized RDD family membrane protein YckC
MSDQPRDPGMTPGDPLGPAPEAPPRHESGLPGHEPAAPQPAPGGFEGGYSSPPPPGALGGAAAAQAPVLGRHQLAGWWSRVGATVIDGIIIGVGALVVTLIFGSLFSIGFADGDTSDAGIVAAIVGLLFMFLAIAIVALLYAPLMMAQTNGKTLGRMAVGIRVVRADGQPMTFGWAMLREVAVKALLFGIAGSFTFGLANLLDVLWPLWDDENRALHDFVVDTRTVKD